MEKKRKEIYASHRQRKKEKIIQLKGSIEQLVAGTLLSSGSCNERVAELQVSSSQLVVAHDKEQEIVEPPQPVARELRRLVVQANPLNAPRSTCQPLKEAERLFCLQYMKVSSSPRVPNEPFNQKKDLTVTSNLGTLDWVCCTSYSVSRRRV